MSTRTRAPLMPDAACKYGPWAVIAGASDGTGEGFARELAALGINLVLVARRGDMLKALGAELSAKHGIQTRVLVQDLMAIDAGQAMLDATAGLDVGLYVSNAGADGVGTGFLDRPAGRWQQMVNMNVRTVIDSCHGFGSRMRARGSGGGLLLMCSMSALAGLPWMAIYSSTKAFEANFAEALWGELAQDKIDVLAVLAPKMDTPCLHRNTAGTGMDLVGQVAHDPLDVVRQSLAWLPNGPLLLFPSNPDSEDMVPQMNERRRRTEMMMTIGKSMFCKDAANAK